MIEKLKSRKFLTTLLTNIVAIASLFLNFGNPTVQIIAMIVMAVSNTLYSIVEGNIDAKRVVTTIKETAIEVEKRLDQTSSSKE